MIDYRKLIRDKRIEKGFSQYNLADIIGVTQPQINAIERGRRTPSLEVLIKICEALDIKLFPDEAE